MWNLKYMTVEEVNKIFKWAQVLTFLSYWDFVPTKRINVALGQAETIHAERQIALARLYFWIQ